MKIRKDDYQDILSYLIRKREEGYEFVACLNDPFPVNKEGLFTFFAQYDAQQFCDKMSNDIYMIIWQYGLHTEQWPKRSGITR
ncbi:hypothetical protein [Parafilimonas sp.]|uniref:hypothetical protein n=1 Tax=Parafilimonas sp. TaxID=1969739 RepID=UPI0039E5971D